MNWLTVFTTVFDLIWLTMLLVLLWKIWKSSERRTNATQLIVTTLISVAESNAQSAKIAAQAAQDAVNLLKEQHHELH